MKKKNYSKNIKELNDNGITIIKNFYTMEECKKLITKSKILYKYLKLKKHQFSKYCQVINSPFQYDKLFYNYIFNDRLNQILKIILDEHYVLLNSNIINRSIDIDIISTRSNMGERWHNDARDIGGRILEHKFAYIIVTMLEDFSKQNACTEFLKKSHKLKKNEINKKLKKESNINSLTGKAGSIAIFDAKLFHRGGISKLKNRWSLYSYYGPWFVKPYFNYSEMLGKKIHNLPKKIKKILHYYSMPPKNDLERNFTLQTDKYL